MIIMIMITMIEIRKKFFRLVTSVGQRKNSESPKTLEESLSHARGQIVKMLMQVEPYTKSAYPIQTHSNKPFGYSLF